MKRIAAIFLLITAGGISLLYYYWRQATNLPTWYSTQETTNNILILKDEIEPKQARKNIEAKITAAINQQVTNSKNVEVQLNEDELNNILASEITKNDNSGKIAEAVKAVKTNIQDGKVESGAVVNIAEVTNGNLRSGEVAALKKVVKAFPTLENREIYIGIEGKPTIENGKLQFDENTKIKIGNLSFTQAELSQKLGIPESKIRQLIDQKLQVGKFQVNDIELNDGNALLKGSVN